MPTARSYTLSNVTLIKFLKNRQLAIYDRTVSSDTRIPDVFVMRHPDNTQAYLKLWTGSSDGITTLEMDVEESLPTGYTESNSYSFNNLAGDIWLDGNHIIIGTGDVRDLTVTAFIDKYPLQNSAEKAILLTCTSNYTIRIYWKTNGPIAYSIGDIAINKIS